MAITSRTTNLARVVRQVDPDYEKQKRIEPEYDFKSMSGRMFTGNTAKRGPYETPLTGFTDGAHDGVTSLPGD